MNYAMPDYNNCLVNLSNSILKAFGAETTAPALPMADKLLEGGHKNVVVLLMDAMGISILEKNMNCSATCLEITSAYPSLTLQYSLPMRR